MMNDSPTPHSSIVRDSLARAAWSRLRSILNASIAGWSKRVWPTFSVILIVHGIYGLAKDVASFSRWLGQTYTTYIAPIDIGQVALRSAEASFALYSTGTDFALSWLSEPLRDPTVVLACVYGPQFAKMIANFVGIQIEALRPKKGWRFWMEVRALIVISMIGYIVWLGYLENPLLYERSLNILVFTAPLYFYYALAFFFDDVGNIKREIVALLLCFSAWFAAIAIPDLAIQIRLHAFLAFVSGMNLGVYLCCLKLLSFPK